MSLALPAPPPSAVVSVPARVWSLELLAFLPTQRALVLKRDIHSCGPTVNLPVTR